MPEGKTGTHLGSESEQASRNQPNGSSATMVQADNVALTLSIPRGWNGCFDPALIAK